MCHTKVILIQLNFLHQRRHHKGESLPVEVVQRVADKHGQEYSASVVSITWFSHGCRFGPTKLTSTGRIEDKSRGGSKLLLSDRPVLPVTVNFASGSSVQKQLLTCGEVFTISRRS